MDKNMKSKFANILITGASSGIGEALSLFYAENGFLRQFYVKELNDFKFCRMSYHKVIEEI